MPWFEVNTSKTTAIRILLSAKTVQLLQPENFTCFETGGFPEVERNVIVKIGGKRFPGRVCFVKEVIQGEEFNAKGPFSSVDDFSVFGHQQVNIEDIK